uniref:Uncharacterized protein n=1 Tax=Mycetohabitans sp. TaxID=2571162 RepID=A0A6B9HFB7_9BURK|nr:hypothetical protein [Mycetohabitans sp.]
MAARLPVAVRVSKALNSSPQRVASRFLFFGPALCQLASNGPLFCQSGYS